MFNINRTLKKGVRYPDKELLCDYQDLHFADLVSTPAVADCHPKRPSVPCSAVSV